MVPRTRCLLFIAALLAKVASCSKEAGTCPFACYPPRCRAPQGGRCTETCSPVQNADGKRTCGPAQYHGGEGSVDCSGCADASAGDEQWKGICYTPLPRKGFVKEGVASGSFQDDFMTADATPLWGEYGRDDLSTIAKLGANRVRMYGNNPDNDHRAFLDAARSKGLKVIPGLSNFPYNQMENNCNDREGDCSEVVKESYLQNLKKGFAEGNRYHTGLDHLIVINEPELVLGVGGTPKDPYGVEPDFWVKGVISAIDGIVEAEKEYGIEGNKIPLTPTVTFGPCNLCIGQSGNATDSTGTRPALGQMLQFKDGMLHPEKYGYVPKNDLSEIFYTRILLSANTNNLAPEVEEVFLPYYEAAFPNMPLLFEEYHSWRASDADGLWGGGPQKKDLTQMLNFARGSAQLLGFNFFEFQVSYDKDEIYEELFFGLFGLGDYKITEMDFFYHWTPVMCLKNTVFNNGKVNVTNADGSVEEKVIGWEDSSDLTEAITTAFGGAGIVGDELCTPNATKVPLTSEGFEAIKSLGFAKCPAAMVTFTQRLVESLGGEASKNSGISEFARSYCYDGRIMKTPVTQVRRLRTKYNFEQMVDDLRQKPGWALWSPFPSCIASRRTDTTSLGRLIHQVCYGKLQYFDCIHIPPQCSSSLLTQADYVLSTYYSERTSINANANPIEDCYFNGSAFYASATYQYEAGAHVNPECVVSEDPWTSPLTDEGYAAVKRRKDAAANTIFINRVLKSKKIMRNATVCDDDKYTEFVEDPSQSLWELIRDLNSYWWVCGGSTGRPCEEGCEPHNASSFLQSKWFKGVLCATGVLLILATIGTCIFARRLPEESEEWHKRSKERGGYTQTTTRAVTLPQPTASRSFAMAPVAMQQVTPATMQPVPMVRPASAMNFQPVLSQATPFMAMATAPPTVRTARSARGQ
eukprot:TRINITY_DN1313_c0_g1_i1.p1 TRINITY_DN1313_c0_g1~~TRINITY_DN1313_c0_g1_i1.p1  ORF type:complete len:921 (+),score=223.77 TRINITY_DN1313_c0_g1_i1:71-2833(+)